MKETRTQQNLIMAYLGESDARNRYTWYAKVAKKEGYEQIGAIFLETAEQELSHAKNFHKLLGETDNIAVSASVGYAPVGSTLDNLRNAVSGESEEYAKLYPFFAETADEEGFSKVAAFFRAIAKVEEVHANRFKRLMDNIENDRVFKKDEPVIWQCRKCGYVSEGYKAPDLCPGCFHPQAYFEVKAENF